MRDFDGNKDSAEHGRDDFLWGDNLFESGVLALADGESAADGTVLTRAADGKYKVAGDSTGALSVLVDRKTFDEAGSYPVRVCIGGKLNRERIKLAGNALTDADADALRGYGIIAEKAAL